MCQQIFGISRTRAMRLAQVNSKVNMRMGWEEYVFYFRFSTQQQESLKNKNKTIKNIWPFVINCTTS